MPARDAAGKFIKQLGEEMYAAARATIEGATPVGSGGGGIGPGSVAGQAVGGGGAAATGGIGKALSSLKGGGGGIGWGPWIYLLLAQLGIGSLMKKGHQMKMMDIETQAMGSMAEAITPESMYYKAMLPKAQEQNQMAQAFLLQQLLGGGGPQLATGEELIGGR